MWQSEVLDRKLSRFFETSSRTVLSLLIIVILLATLDGVGVKLGFVAQRATGAVTQVFSGCHTIAT